MIYDDAGYIAGVQSVLLESNVDMAYNNLTKQVGIELLYTIYLSYSLCRKDLKIQITMKLDNSKLGSTQQTRQTTNNKWR